MYLLIVSKQQSNSNNEELKIGTACEKMRVELDYNIICPSHATNVTDTKILGQIDTLRSAISTP